MDKLEPILKQKFWILLGIGLIMTITGWWMDTGTLKAAFTARETEIKAADGKVPSGQIPNSDWTKQLAVINTLQDASINSTKLALWERQKQHMFWPAGMEEYAWKNGYRKDIDLSVRENYRLGYVVDVDRVYAAANPFNWLDGTGIVEFRKEKLPKLIDIGTAPTAERMWDFQEDLWLLESLLQTISDFNGGPNATRQDASVHVIETLTLHGGQPAAQRKVSAPASGGGASGGAVMPGGDMPGMFGSAGGSTGAAATAVAADFDRREEFGDDGSGAGGMGGIPDMTQMMNASASSGAPSGAASAASKVRRYVEDDKNLPYKTRGFYLSVIMDHRKVPSLIAALSANEKSAWPVEIVRVQVVRLIDDDLTGSGTGGYQGGSPFGSGPMTTASGGFGGPSELGGFPGAATTGFAESGLPGDLPGGSGFGSPSGSAFTLPTGGSGGNNAANQQAQAAIQQLQAAVQDPYMAKVALAGFITLYTEVTPPPAPANPTPPAAAVQTPQTPPAAAAPTTGTPTNPAEAQPAEPSTEEKKPAAEGAPTESTSDTKPDPAATQPEATKDAKPPESVEPPKQDAAPKQDATVEKK